MLHVYKYSLIIIVNIHYADLLDLKIIFSCKAQEEKTVYFMSSQQVSQVEILLKSVRSGKFAKRYQLFPNLHETQFVFYIICSQNRSFILFTTDNDISSWIHQISRFYQLYIFDLFTHMN